MTYARTTGGILAHHTGAMLARDLDELMRDYRHDSVLYLPTGPIRGSYLLRRFFREFLDEAPPGLADRFEILRQDVEGPLGYIVWQALPDIVFATATLVIHDGFIRHHTFAAQLAEQPEYEAGE